MKRSIFILGLCAVFNGAFAQTFNCGDTLLDTRDGKKYATVLIGTACWMKQNLNYGTAITSNTSGTTHYDMSNNGIVEKYAPMGNNANLPTYGALYEWPEMMAYSTTAGGQGICPNGWHVPTDAEFQTMIVAAGGTVIPGAGGNKLKALGEGVGPNGLGTNTSGFTARAAGDRDAFGIFYGLGNRFIFWTSTETNSTSAYHYTLWNDRDTIERLVTQKYTGLSCRCVRNVNAGVKEQQGSQIFRIFPNPVVEELRIESGNTSEKRAYTICNAMGERIAEGILHESENRIALGDLNPGIYFIRIRQGEGSEEKKFILMK